MGVVVPVILCGGRGSRLWPASSDSAPKIFFTMADGRSLLQHAMDRARRLAGVNHVVAVTAAAYADAVAGQWEASRQGSGCPLTLLAEPAPRDTAPAIAVAARHVAAHFGKDAILVCLPADHLTESDAEMAGHLDKGVAAAAADRITIFGVTPTAPLTRYGYIEATGGEVISFHEKPGRGTAEAYYMSGRHFWNSGIVCATARTIERAVSDCAPDVAVAGKRAIARATAWDNGRLITLPDDAYRECPDISFDRAVLEHAGNLDMIALTSAWTDMGSWQSYGRLEPADAMGNRVRGNAVLLGTRNSIVQAGRRAVKVVGLDNIVVVDTPDGLLIADVNEADRVRELTGAPIPRPDPAE